MTTVVYIAQLLWDTLNPLHWILPIEPFGDLIDIIMSGFLAFSGN